MRFDHTMTDSPLDFATINMLRGIMEDDFDLLIDTFINDTRQRLQNLKDNCAQLSADEIKQEAHSLKGSSSNIGALVMSNLCLLVEEQARTGNLDGIDKKINAIAAAFDDVQKALDVKS